VRRQAVSRLKASERWPELASALRANPSLGFKFLVPCHHAGLSVAARAERVVRHHELARVLLGADRFRLAHIEPEGLLVAQAPLPRGEGMLPLRLHRHAPCWREGELTLGLHDPFGTLLYTLTFSLHAAGPHAEESAVGMLIGSVVGVAPIESIRHLARLMEGMHPKALLLSVAQALCRHWRLAELLAVGRAGHVFADTDRAERLQFDYDAFWREKGGVPKDASLRLFALPFSGEERSLETVAANKRAQYRRRYEMLRDTEADLSRRLPGGGLTGS
jgi:uncharacterized protein VirK/YbjX